MNLSRWCCNILNITKNFKPYNNSRKSSYYQKVNTGQENDVGAIGWMLLAIPTVSFALGTWQVKRKMWKENLLADMMNKTNSDPVSLTENLDNLDALDYKPVYAKGKFLHDQELYMGPRSLMVNGDAEGEGSLFSQKGSNQGYLIITPFKLDNQDKIILVNRGWVPHNKKNPKTRKEGQVEDIVDIVGIVRSNENRPTFLPKNNEQSNQWFYRDIYSMCKVTGADPIFLDQTTDLNTPGGPIGGQTRVTLRNEHMSYIITWYGLSASTGYMWYRRFIKKLPLK